eukprot:TRINITY_DN10364_c0_g3_i1.p1 TRINITY_DN10364_c0_g3~~TRINITY_DN10364_c0_g3_i1.p1  ORF type:complete len:553 (-),score=38.06 TRINITY_DN10364_c0_g3_i1:484-2022(-)
MEGYYDHEDYEYYDYEPEVAGYYAGLDQVSSVYEEVTQDSNNSEESQQYVLHPSASFTHSTYPDIEIPHRLLCPITEDLMSDPVVLVETGQVYERSAIQKWLSSKHTDPITNTRLRTKQMVAIYVIRSECEEFIKNAKKFKHQDEKDTDVEKVCQLQIVEKILDDKKQQITELANKIKTSSKSLDSISVEKDKRMNQIKVTTQELKHLVDLHVSQFSKAVIKEQLDEHIQIVNSLIENLDTNIKAASTARKISDSNLLEQYQQEHQQFEMLVDKIKSNFKCNEDSSSSLQSINEQGTSSCRILRKNCVQTTHQHDCKEVEQDCKEVDANELITLLQSGTVSNVQVNLDEDFSHLVENYCIQVHVQVPLEIEGLCITSSLSRCSYLKIIADLQIEVKNSTFSGIGVCVEQVLPLYLRTHYRFYDVCIQNAPWHGILLQDCPEFFVNEVVIIDCARSGICCRKSRGVINDSSISDCGKFGVWLDNDSDVTHEGLEFSGNIHGNMYFSRNTLRNI